MPNPILPGMLIRPMSARTPAAACWEIPASVRKGIWWTTVAEIAIVLRPKATASIQKTGVRSASHIVKSNSPAGARDPSPDEVRVMINSSWDLALSGR